MSYYPQNFAVIAHNTEQHRGFGPGCPPEESHIIPRGIIYFHFGKQWWRLKSAIASLEKIWVILYILIL